MNVRMFALVGATGLALGAGACVDTAADSGLRIIGNLAPDDGCVVDPSSTTFHGNGIIEATSRFGYLFTPVVINDLITLENEPLGPKTIYITHARVDISFYEPGFTGFDASLLSFSVPTSGSIEPNGGKTGYAFEVVPAELLSAIGDQLGAPVANESPPRTTLDVQVQMVGTHGGDEVLSNVYRYPVDVCNGCLVSNLGSCATLPLDIQPTSGGACNFAQDGVLECCTAADGALVCPAVPPTT